MGSWRSLLGRLSYFCPLVPRGCLLMRSLLFSPLCLHSRHFSPSLLKYSVVVFGTPPPYFRFCFARGARSLLLCITRLDFSCIERSLFICYGSRSSWVLAPWWQTHSVTKTWPSSPCVCLSRPLWSSSRWVAHPFPSSVPAGATVPLSSLLCGHQRP